MCVIKIKLIIIIAVILCLCIGAALVSVLLRAKDLSDITDGRSAHIGYALDGDGNRVDANELMNYYGVREYRRYHGGIGNTAHRSFRFFDGDGDELFVLTDLGNRNLIKITISGKTETYQFD